MKRSLNKSIVAAVAALLLLPALLARAAEPNTLTDQEKKAGFKLLFDGKTTDGWRSYQKKEISPKWQIVDGALTRAEKGAGLGAFDSDLGYGGAVGCHEQPSQPDHQIGEGPGQLTQVGRALGRHQARHLQWHQGHGSVRCHHAQDLVHICGLHVIEELSRHLARTHLFRPPGA